mmetsp:Transcript_12420/g.38282  ORF Transcript_12420/g.38282 Transcript_12420/m.38282 type:complete len:243 (+) Transcript_12420:3844-4572(+)
MLLAPSGAGQYLLCAARAAQVVRQRLEYFCLDGPHRTRCPAPVRRSELHERCDTPSAKPERGLDPPIYQRNGHHAVLRRGARDAGRGRRGGGCLRRDAGQGHGLGRGRRAGSGGPRGGAAQGRERVAPLLVALDRGGRAPGLSVGRAPRGRDGDVAALRRAAARLADVRRRSDEASRGAVGGARAPSAEAPRRPPVRGRADGPRRAVPRLRRPLLARARDQNPLRAAHARARAPLGPDECER